MQTLECITEINLQQTEKEKSQLKKKYGITTVVNPLLDLVAVRLRFFISYKPMMCLQDWVLFIVMVCLQSTNGY